MGEKRKLTPLLGDNPLGDLAAIGVPSRKPGAKPRRRPRSAGKKKRAARTPPSARQAISEAEKKIDEALRTISESGDDAEGDAKETLVDFASRMQTRMAGIQVEAGEERRALATLLRLIRPSFYLKKLSPLLLAGRSTETDEFGMDPTLEKNLQPMITCLFEKYFRISVEGLEHVPPSGGCIVVANHAPVLSLDGIMLRQAVASRLRADVRWLMENELFYIPYAGVLSQRIGGVRASQENARLLLDKGYLIITFPEGILGISTGIRERYKIKRFGRGGYIRLAIEHGVPVIPAAVKGPQNSFPILWKMTAGAGFLSVPFIPITPLFPLLGPLGLLPLPLKWTIRFAPPLALDYPIDARLDQPTVNRLNNSVRETIQAMIDELRERG